MDNLVRLDSLVHLEHPETLGSPVRRDLLEQLELKVTVEFLGQPGNLVSLVMLDQLEPRVNLEQPERAGQLVLSDSRANQARRVLLDQRVTLDQPGHRVKRVPKEILVNLD
jgi:hypothetical protein